MEELVAGLQESFRNIVSRLQTLEVAPQVDLTTVEVDIAALEAAVLVLQGDIATVQGDVTALENPPTCLAINTNGFIGGYGAVAAVVPFNSESWDTDNMHDNSTNNSRLTATTAGKYQINGAIVWSTAAVVLDAYLALCKNGVANVVAQVDTPAPAADNPAQTISMEVSLAAGDYVELFVAQNSGLNRSLIGTSCFFSAVRVSN